MLLLLGAACGLATTTHASQTSKVDAQFGYFSLTAKNSQGSSTISNLSLLDLTFALPVHRQVDFCVGYSLYALNGSSVELGFGPNLGVRYFPLTASGTETYAFGNSVLKQFEIFRPFVALFFHQRQFQTVQSSFAGIGLSAGTEYAFTNTTFLTGAMNYRYLKGPLQSRIVETSLTLGVGTTLD